MKTITPDIKALYDAALIKRAVPVPVPFHYRKWLRYYLDFCTKYHQPRDSRRSLAPFVEKLKAKNQSEQQRKQATDAVSIFYQVKNTGSEGDDARALKYAETEISIKKNH